MKEICFFDLSAREEELLSQAEKAMQQAYSPYSGFSVGAALLSNDERIFPGANLETASYDVICAERAALASANAAGCRSFTCLAIISRGKDFATKQVSAPCGRCRQMLYEFSQLGGHDLKIIMSTTNKDKIIISSINELLPLPFGPNDLGLKRR